MNGAIAIVALIKRGKKGIIKIRKQRNRGKHNKGKRGTYCKKEVNIVRNVELRTF